MRYVALLLAPVLSFLSMICSVEGSEPVTESPPAVNLALPFEGPGQLLIIASRGWPPNDILVVTTREGSRILPFERPSGARWRSPHEIIVQQGGPGWSGNKLFRLDQTGHIAEKITDGYFLSPEPAPDGRRIAVVHVLHDGGVTALEIRDLTDGFRLLRAFPRDDLVLFSGKAAWDPDAKQLLVSVKSDDYDIGEHLQSRLAIVSPDSGTVKRLYNSRKDRKRDPRGVVPMFWHRSGIYAWSARGVLRCDPQGGGCDRVYDPGDAWHVIGGTTFGAGEALLLVADVKADPLEPRAKEIHRLDLKTGKGALWARLADDLFVSDIDWIEASDAAADQAEASERGTW